MPRIQDVKLEIVRPGPPHNQLLSPLTSYMGLCGDGSPITFRVKFEHRKLLNRLEHLRYVVPAPDGGFEKVAEGTRTGELNDLGSDMADVLARVTSLNAELNRYRSSSIDPASDRGFVHLRLVLSGSELSLLPFELAMAPQSFPGEGLHFCLEGSLPIVVTREIRRSRPLPIRWNQYRTPRVLFISSAPGNLTVPTQLHVRALRTALEPWIEWPRDKIQRDERDEPRVERREDIERERLGNVKKRLRVLLNASLEDIYEACGREEFSHIHILAHGDHRHEAGEERFGVALCEKRNPNEKVVVDGVQLAAALRAGTEDGNRRSEPVMVTLATCDSGQTGSVLVPGGSIAHDLHSAGIPWVCASQFPLTKRGSVLVAEFMYSRLLRGDDPRRVLYELRRYLYMNADRNHDWASLVCYASVPEDFDDQVAAYFESQTRLAIDVQMGKTDAIAERRAPVEQPGEQPGGEKDAEKVAIDDALHEAERLLGAWEKRLPNGKSMQDRGQRTSCYGIKGSVLKRFGLVYGRRDDHDSAAEVLEKAHKAYQKGMDEWATDGEGYHWTATQYLCLSAILGREKDPETLALCRRFAERDMKSPDVDTITRAWAHGTLAELALLSLWHDDPSRAQESQAAQIEDRVLRHCDEIIELTGVESFPTKSTRRHFQRYVDKWYLKKWEQNELLKIAQAAVQRLTPVPKIKP